MKRKETPNAKNATDTPTRIRPPLFRELSKPDLLVYVALLVMACAAGFFLRPIVMHAPASPQSDSVPPQTTAVESHDVAIPCHPGPWGDLEYIPITIAAPEELLPVRAMTDSPTRWFFKNYSSDDLVRFLDTVDVSRDQKEQLLNPSTMQIHPSGVEVVPSADTLMSLVPTARAKLYKVLCGFPENSSTFVYVPAQSIDERFYKGGVSEKTVAQLRQLSCVHGRYLVFSGMSCILSEMPTYEERQRFVKVLTQQKTLLFRLRIGPHSDVAALNRYWGKACWTTDVRAMFESLSELPEVVSISLMNILPPFPTSLAYTFPKPQPPVNGVRVRHDCHWTAFNFFRDVPDDRFSDPNYVRQKLSEDYFPLLADPRYGDLVVLSKPDGSIVHSAVYLADDIAFTKNGDTPVTPWMFSTIDDLVDKYSFQAPPDQKVLVSYFRNKSF